MTDFTPHIVVIQDTWLDNYNRRNYQSIPFGQDENKAREFFLQAVQDAKVKHEKNLRIDHINISFGIQCSDDHEDIQLLEDEVLIKR